MIEILFALLIAIQTSPDGEPLIYDYHGLSVVVAVLVVVGVVRIARGVTDR